MKAFWECRFVDCLVRAAGFHLVETVMCGGEDLKWGVGLNKDSINEGYLPFFLLQSMSRPRPPPTHPPLFSAAALATVLFESPRTRTSEPHQISWKHEARGEESGLKLRDRGRCRIPSSLSPPTPSLSLSR